MRGGKKVRNALGDEASPLNDQVQKIVARLQRLGSKRARDGMARYAISSEKAFGVPMASMQQIARSVGRNHDLALALWKTGWYEARTVAAFLAEPHRLTPRQMDHWCRDFDSWAICDTVCFHMFDRTPHAFRKVEQWSRSNREFVKRAAFALLASLSSHDKQADDAPFLRGLRLIEGAARDERNLVKKGVSWVLRLIGRRNAWLNQAAVEVAQRLIASSHAAARWVGRGALRELTDPARTRRLTRRTSPRGSTLRISSKAANGLAFPKWPY